MGKNFFFSPFLMTSMKNLSIILLLEFFITKKKNTDFYSTLKEFNFKIQNGTSKKLIKHLLTKMSLGNSLREIFHYFSIEVILLFFYYFIQIKNSNFRFSNNYYNYFHKMSAKIFLIKFIHIQCQLLSFNYNTVV